MHSGLRASAGKVHTEPYHAFSLGWPATKLNFERKRPKMQQPHLRIRKTLEQCPPGGAPFLFSHSLLQPPSRPSPPPRPLSVYVVSIHLNICVGTFARRSSVRVCQRKLGVSVN